MSALCFEFYLHATVILRFLLYLKKQILFEGKSTGLKSNHTPVELQSDCFSDCSDLFIRSLFRVSALILSNITIVVMLSQGIGLPTFGMDEKEPEFAGKWRLFVLFILTVSGIVTNIVLYSILALKARLRPPKTATQKESSDSNFSLGLLLVISLFLIFNILITTLKRYANFRAKYFQSIAFSFIPVGIIILKPKIRSFTKQLIIRSVMRLGFLFTFYKTRRIHPSTT